MRKIVLVVVIVTCFMLMAGPLVSGIISSEVSASKPKEACQKVATKRDEWVQKWIIYGYHTKMINECNGEYESAWLDIGPNWSMRYKRYIFGDGSIVGSTFQGYFGGKVTYYVICLDGRARVYGRSFGYWGMGASQEICNTL